MSMHRRRLRPTPRLAHLWCVLASGVAASAVLVAVGPHSPPAVAADVSSIDCGELGAASTPAAPQLASFTADAPRRIVDTRDGTGGATGPVDADCALRIDVDAANVPAEAVAVAFSITTLGQQAGFQQVFPCDGGRPATSNVNNRANRVPTPNLVLGLPDADREVCVSTSVTADLIVDVSGWWTEEGPSRFRAVDPVRVDDSRDAGGLVPGGGEPRAIDLSGLVPVGTTAIVGNLTIAQPAAAGFATIFPCDDDPPLASNVNMLAGEARAVSVIVGLDSARRVCTSSDVDHHVILDLAGYYAPAPQWGPAAELRPEAGARLADSRDGTGGWTAALAPGERRRLDLAGLVPDGSQITGVIANVTVTQPADRGFATVTGCAAADPDTSSVNFAPGSVSSNLVTVDLGVSTEICVVSSVRAHVIVDLFGVLRAESDDVFVERLSVGTDTSPAYRPDATDFITSCVDPLPVDIDLLPGAAARINGVLVPSGVTVVDLAGPDDVVRIDLVRGGVLRRHFVRCVPDDFDRIDVSLLGDPEPGWYMTTIQADGGRDRVVILDEFGAPVWWLDVPIEVALFELSNVGDLLVQPIRGLALSWDPDRGAVRARLDGTIIEEYVTVDDPPGLGGTDNPVDHHDIVELPTGGVALISYPLVEDVDILGIGGGADEIITDNLIQELDADGNLVWEWRMSDHVAFEPGGGGTSLVYTHDEVPFAQRWIGDFGHPGVEDVDVFHINSIELAGDGSGDYIVSARHIDAVFRIDRATDDIEWILRSDEITDDPKAGAGAVLTIVDDPLGGPRRPHDAILDGDRLTFLDNRTATGEPSRGVTYMIDTSGPGAGTATLVEEFLQPNGQASAGLGSNRPGPAGGRIVNFGGGVQPHAIQYDAAGDPTMTITAPDGGFPYRIVWYPKSTFDVTELRSLAGGTLELPE
ncbi:MAG: aryl-sulfate sulfotransferase [Actinomycetota bacterium]